MPAYSLAIFDFDGTLADSFPWFLTVLDKIADRFDIPRVKPEDIDGLRDLSTREVLSRLGVPAYKLPAMALYVRQLSAEGVAGIPLFSGAAEALRSLRQLGVKLALVSSNAETNVRAVLGEAAGLIDHYACGSSLWGKAQKFGTVLRLSGQPARGTIAIGDEVRDIEAARKAGLSAGALTFGFNSRKALAEHRPDYLFDSYPQMVEALAG
jgi:phosphoglycolate phosphatase